ncbi:MAG: nitroreductase family protein [Calditrichaeota bacterium]|nr:nitroreductase family protein [Calditrichota bacterium]
MVGRSRLFCQALKRRRTVRDFSDRKIPREVIENCLLAAGSAPNGANRQPWHFVVVETPGIKQRIRLAAEKEEQEFYGGRAPQEWLEALSQFGTDARKPFLETASHLIAIFAESYEAVPDGGRIKNYYVQESVGIACGLLITALHQSGVATLTHTPSPMKFLNEILGRPENERPFLLLVAGFPAPDAAVPDISKKSLNQIATFL